MTGYGAGEARTETGRWVVEARSVNHRFLEIAVRLPRELAALEDRVRAAVGARVARGRIEVSVVRDDPSRRSRSVRIDVELARRYASAIREMQAALEVTDPVPVSLVLSLPDVVRIEDEREDPEAVWALVEPALATALANLVSMRRTEGERLGRDLGVRVDRLQALVDQIAARADRVLEIYAERLRRRVSELTQGAGVGGSVDEARIATEVALFAERSDLSEEITRLGSHFEQTRSLLNGDGPVGRRLEFLLQEMGREVNTIGSKANDLAITQAVLEMKSELESLREQVANVE
jgi:uncharacterized protein (TIGR00255 family)